MLIALGAGVGYQLATKVQMTQMPELVAIMHSLVGLAAVIVGFNADMTINMVQAAQAAGDAVEGAFATLVAKKDGVEIAILRIELVLGIWIGAVTFTGSVIALWQAGGQGRHIGQETAGRAYAERGRSRRLSGVDVCLSGRKR